MLYSLSSRVYRVNILYTVFQNWNMPNKVMQTGWCYNMAIKKVAGELISRVG